MTTTLKTRTYINRKTLLDAAIDVILLMAWVAVAVTSGLYLFRGWTSMIALIGIPKGITLVVGCAVLAFCLLYFSVTNLVVNISFIRRTVFYETEEDIIQEKEK